MPEATPIASQETPPESSETGKKKKRLSPRRFFGCAGLLVLILVSLILLVATFESWTGARAWKEVRTTLVDAGIPLEVHELLPEAPPASQNFGGTPLLAALVDFEPLIDPINSEIEYRHPDLVERFAQLRLPEAVDELKPKPFANWATARPVDLDAVAAALRESGTEGTPPATPSESEGSAQFILDTLHESFSEDLATLDDAAHRPHAMLLIPVGDTFIEQIATPVPHLFELMKFQKLQAIRLGAALEVGDTDEARAAFLTMQGVAEMAGSQPFLVSHLVRLSNEEMLISATWQGLTRNQWSEDDLAWIASRLEGRAEAILDHLTLALTMEMNTMLIRGTDFMKSGDLSSVDLLTNLSSDAMPDRRWNKLLSLIPDGVWDHNKAKGCRLIYETGIQPAKARNLHGPEIDLEKEFGRKTPRNFFVSIVLPATQRVSDRSFHAATGMNLLQVAIALERYRLTHDGNYPDALADLVPDLMSEIPVDWADPNGGPLRYLRTGDRFKLYSIGLNGNDEGGAIEIKGVRPNLNDGDWAWSYEPLPREAGKK